MQLQELVQWIGLIAALKRGQPGGEVISAMELSRASSRAPSCSRGRDMMQAMARGIAASRDQTEMSWYVLQVLIRLEIISWC